MKEGCYVGNTTESSPQHGRRLRPLFFFCCFSRCAPVCPSPAVFAHTSSPFAQVWRDGPPLAASAVRGRLTVHRGWRKMYNRRTESNTWQLAHKSVLVWRGATFLQESTVLENKSVCRFFLKPFREKKTPWIDLDSSLSFYVVIFLTFIYPPPPPHLL